MNLLKIGIFSCFAIAIKFQKLSQGPDEDQEEELDMAEIRMKQEENRLAVAREVAEKQRAALTNQSRAQVASIDVADDEGITWGMRECSIALTCIAVALEQ